MLGIPIIGDILGGVASAFGAASQRKWEAKQAQKQMDFQERMSSTAHQREVADLRAAGLNPVLSVNAGASSPGGAMAVGQTEPIGVGVSSARESARLRSELMSQRKGREVADAEIGLKGAQEAMTWASLPQKAVVGEAVTSGKNAISNLINWGRERFQSLRERAQDEARLRRLKATESSARRAAENRRRSKWNVHGRPPVISDQERWYK